MNEAYLCLGGNMGNREAVLGKAIDEIGSRAGAVIRRSAIYETEPWGVNSQQAYLNCCLCVQTPLQAEVLLSLLLQIEKELGRERTPWTGYEPRTIDLDILLFNQEVIASEHLMVPHPRLQLRRFVLVPLAEIAPGYLHPVLNKTIFNLLGACQDTSDVKPYI